jgi:hypothetical protein
VSHINEMKSLISQKEQDIQNKLGKDKAFKELTARILRKKYQSYLKKTAFREIVYHAQLMQREKRLAAYSKNALFRRRLRLLFGSWRGVTHQWFKQRIDSESKAYENSKRQEMLTQWDQQVDTLKIYMAQLQERIRQEVQAREQLTLSYEQSLNKGVDQLNTET